MHVVKDGSVGKASNRRAQPGSATCYLLHSHPGLSRALTNSNRAACQPPAQWPGSLSMAPARHAGSQKADAVATSTAAECTTSVAPDLGFPHGLELSWELGRVLGKGGNGVVRECRRPGSCAVFAVKSIPKVRAGLGLGNSNGCDTWHDLTVRGQHSCTLKEADYHHVQMLKEGSEKKKAGHIQSLLREISVLQKLKGSLNIIELEEVFEDDTHVHIVQEACTGGELAHAIGSSHYSERTAASYMRAVLRTLAQCHANHILHRDIKPGNFMLLSTDDRAPLRAIDFGLAVPFDPQDLPLTNLDLEGTPWFMAPEVLSSQVLPASDVWAAGCMAHQLLTGRLPFDDHHNPNNASITAIWRSVLTDPLQLDKSWWAGISDEALDFVGKLLHRDPAKRPTAKEALQHPWLKGTARERGTGKQLQMSVVARIQRFAASSSIKRSVLRMIAEDLLAQPHLLPSMCALNQKGKLLVTGPASECMGPLYEQLGMGDKTEEASVTQVAEALKAAGFRLSSAEMNRLMEQLDPEGVGMVQRSAFAASQVDWRHVQDQHRDMWLSLARDAFRTLDSDKDGVLRPGELLSALAKSLPDEGDLTAEVAAAMEEAGREGEMQMNIDDFMRMLHVNSVDSLDMYDERNSSVGSSSAGKLSVLQRGSSNSIASLSQHGVGASRHGALHGHGSSSSMGEGSQRGLWGDNSQHTPGSPAFVWRFEVVSHADAGAVERIATAAAATSPWRFEVVGAGAAAPPAARQLAWAVAGAEAGAGSGAGAGTGTGVEAGAGAEAEAGAEAGAGAGAEPDVQGEGPQRYEALGPASSQPSLTGSNPPFRFSLIGAEEPLYPSPSSPFLSSSQTPSQALVTASLASTAHHSAGLYPTLNATPGPTLNHMAETAASLHGHEQEKRTHGSNAAGAAIGVMGMGHSKSLLLQRGNLGPLRMGNNRSTKNPSLHGAGMVRHALGTVCE